MGGASGTFAAMLDATEGETVTLPLSLGRIVVDEARVMQAALNHCRNFLERIDADYGGHVKYEAHAPPDHGPAQDVADTRAAREKLPGLKFWARDVRGAEAIRASAPSSMRAG